ncbi:L,D-transpeptidase [Paracoccus panacisoli]|uniref:L,D-transpeptidase n=1 Tax=Paracoccus panacisoli TaxID=1510163 RepID=A0ABV6T5V5_9RHOB
MRIAYAVLLAAVLGLAACGPDPAAQVAPATPATPAVTPAIYQARTDTGPGGEPLPIAAIKPAYLRDRNVRAQVPYNGPDPAGSIVVDPYARFLYLVEPGGTATRVGIAVGKAGLGFSGTATVGRKARWPSWTPTANMVATEPDLYGPVKDGKAGGLDNPLGSRALYLYQGSRDTLYRIHGTMDPSSIGKATSAGCIRLFNQDIMDLFDRVPTGTRVKVRTAAESRALEGPLVETPDGYLEPAAAAPVVAMSPAGVPVVESAVPAAWR